jgi:hypothetical protein
VTVRAQASDHAKLTWTSWARFTADDRDTVDLATATRVPAPPLPPTRWACSGRCSHPPGTTRGPPTSTGPPRTRRRSRSPRRPTAGRGPAGGWPVCRPPTACSVGRSASTGWSARSTPPPRGIPALPCWCWAAPRRPAREHGGAARLPRPGGPGLLPRSWPAAPTHRHPLPGMSVLSSPIR